MNEIHSSPNLPERLKRETGCPYLDLDLQKTFSYVGETAYAGAARFLTETLGPTPERLILMDNARVEMEKKNPAGFGWFNPYEPVAKFNGYGYTKNIMSPHTAAWIRSTFSSRSAMRQYRLFTASRFLNEAVTQDRNDRGSLLYSKPRQSRGRISFRHRNFRRLQPGRGAGRLNRRRGQPVWRST